MKASADPPSHRRSAPRGVKIASVELEEGGEEFFSQALPEYELVFVPTLADVPPDTECISIFIHSEVTPEFLDSHRAVRLVATRSTTWDHIDLPACAQRGVTACGVPSYGDHTVAEHAFALLLALARRLRDALGANRNGKFSYEALRGVELRGKTLGIIGAGRVGRAMIPIAEGFGMKALIFDPVPQPSASLRAGCEYVSLDELLVRSHVISLHARLTPVTYHLLDRASLAKCRRGVLIINTARGRLIDTEALVAALDDGIVAGAGLDVLGEERVFRNRATAIISNHIVGRLHGEVGDKPHADAGGVSEPIGKLLLLEKLLARPNVVFTPHTAFNTAEAIDRINRTTVENIRAFLAGSLINVLPPELNAGPTESNTADPQSAAMDASDWSTNGERRRMEGRKFSQRESPAEP